MSIVIIPILQLGKLTNVGFKYIVKCYTAGLVMKLQFVCRQSASSVYNLNQHANHAALKQRISHKKSIHREKKKLLGIKATIEDEKFISEK
jgi:hypothetical protein